MVKQTKPSRPTFIEEEQLWNNGYECVIGVDEVGRGAFAGPLVAAGVVFAPNCHNNSSKEFIGITAQVNDSKILSAVQREKISQQILSCIQDYAIEVIPVSTINRVGVGKANQIAIRKVVSRLHKSVSFVLIDGFWVKNIKGIGLKKQKAIVKGDQKVMSIAAASVIAKVFRDKLMSKLSQKYPEYGLDINKGYGTRFHQNAIKKHGLSPVHRSSFSLDKFL